MTNFDYDSVYALPYDDETENLYAEKISDIKRYQKNIQKSTQLTTLFLKTLNDAIELFNNEIEKRIDDTEQLKILCEKTPQLIKNLDDNYFKFVNEYVDGKKLKHGITEQLVDLPGFQELKEHATKIFSLEQKIIRENETLSISDMLDLSFNDENFTKDINKKLKMLNKISLKISELNSDFSEYEFSSEIIGALKYYLSIEDFLENVEYIKNEKE